MPQMGYDTKTDRLADCQSQCDFDFDLVNDNAVVTLYDVSQNTFLLTEGRVRKRLKSNGFRAEENTVVCVVLLT
jgi:hypothetical protein